MYSIFCGFITLDIVFYGMHDFYNVYYNVRWFEWLFMQWFYNVDDNIIAYAFVDVTSINVISREPFIWSRY